MEVAKEVWPCSFSEAGGAPAAQAKATSVRQSPPRMRAELLHSRARVPDLATGPEGVAIMRAGTASLEKVFAKHYAFLKYSHWQGYTYLKYGRY